MTVKELKQLLKGVPNDMPVYIGDTTELGGFMFKPACDCEYGSGVMEITEGTEEDGDLIQVFALIPHGIGVPEGQEPTETDELNPQMN